MYVYHQYPNKDYQIPTTPLPNPPPSSTPFLLSFPSPSHLGTYHLPHPFTPKSQLWVGLRARARVSTTHPPQVPRDQIPQAQAGFSQIEYLLYLLYSHASCTARQAVHSAQIAVCCSVHTAISLLPEHIVLCTQCCDAYNALCQQHAMYTLHRLMLPTSGAQYTALHVRLY